MQCHRLHTSGILLLRMLSKEEQITLIILIIGFCIFAAGSEIQLI